MSPFIIAIFAVSLIYMWLNFKYDIQMLQQNSYRIDRYRRWLTPHISSAWRLTDLALILLLCSTLLTTPLVALIVAFVAMAKTVIILRRKYKKPLVFTNRVRRIYTVTALLATAAWGLAAACAFAFQPASGPYSATVIALSFLLLISIFSWAFVIAAVWLLKPVENHINRRYYNEAADILRSMPGLTVIGITGSYGKTSTKHYLHRILSEQFDVLMTPGSYNTPMGVIRTVRELMKPYHSVFICEMGAKQRGDIKEICDLVNPEIGIITAVGPMHLESFGSIENVQATKFELADALPATGLAVLNNDFPMIAARSVTNTRTMRYGITAPDGCQWTASDITYTPQGTSFTACGPDGVTIQLTTKLVGECNISNLLAAIVIARHLGVPDSRIQYAVSQIEQVEHRLNVKQTPGGVTIIDDAFNSNPAGSRMAVDVLSHFTQGRRIIVTPGMIELGESQHRLNAELGRHIGENADIAIIVGQYNRSALMEGLNESGMEKSRIHCVASFSESQRLLSGMLRKGDTVLYENDLPDTFK